MPQRSGEIIAAARGYNQYRHGEFDQLPKMSVNRSIAAEEQYDVRLARRGHTYSPVDTLSLLKGSQIFRRTSQPENRRRPHVRDESSRISELK